jgi:PAS domain S-box-containing protein
MESGGTITIPIDEYESLKKSEADFRSLFDAVPAGVVLLSYRKFIKVNADMCSTFGYSESELIGKNTRILYCDDEEYERVGRELYGALLISRRSLIETKLRRKDGVVLDILIGSSATDPRSPEPMASVSCVIVNITESRRAQNALREKERLMAELFRACPECITLTTLDEGRFIEVNEAVNRLFGYSSDELIGRSIGELGIWDSIDERSVVVERLRRGELVRNYETKLRRKDGTKIDALLSLTTAEMYGRRHIISFATDISGRKRIENELASSVREKENLLRELQHRIKNNLAMIAGIAALEMEQAPDERTRSTLGDLKDRIQSLASLYDLLLRSGRTGQVDLGEYLKAIVELLSGTYADAESGLCIEQRIESMPVDMRQAVPWGLIVNELVTNALKHAFPSGGPGRIIIELHRSENKIELRVSDDGAGFPARAESSESEGLGLGIVHMMTAQLKGEIERSGGPGTTFVIRAPASADGEDSALRTQGTSAPSR